MAESRTVVVVPLKGSNYVTWKVQCRMALMKEGLWGIVNGTETAPPEEEADKRAKFMTKRDRALALVVLSVDPALLYLLGDPEDPVAVWNKLSTQFQKKTWANKLHLRKKLYSLRLNEGDSVQEHIRMMTEVFEELAVIGDPLKEEDQVVYLLASLPESYDMLVTALEASVDVPRMDVVTERLLHAERKQKGREDDRSQSKAMTMANDSRRAVKCYHCGRAGHIRRNCPDLNNDENNPRLPSQKGGCHHRANKTSRDSDSEKDLLVINHALQVSSSSKNWVIDSGATCHMCNSKKAFVELRSVNPKMQVSLGDGHRLDVAGEGVVSLKTKLPDGSFKKCKLLGCSLRTRAGI